MASSTKMKVNYGNGETSDGSKTFGSMNPESTNEALVSTANKFGALQNKTILSIDRIDTVRISG